MMLWILGFLGLVYLVRFFWLFSRSEINRLPEVSERFSRPVLLVLAGTVLACAAWLGVYWYFGLVSGSVWFAVRLFVFLVMASQCWVVVLQDPVSHRVDRFVSRLGYMSVLGVVLPAVFNDGLLLGSVVVGELVLPILMLAVRSVGPADFRISFMVLPALVLFHGAHWWVFFLACLLAAVFYQFVVQFRLGDKEAKVPIGHVLCLFGTAFLFVI